MTDSFGATRRRLADLWALGLLGRNDVALGRARQMIVEDVVTNRTHTLGESVLAQCCVVHDVADLDVVDEHQVVTEQAAVAAPP